jgi:membrane protein implicated in regulation of membrane protease activity
MDRNATVARRPRYVLGTFWLILGIIALVASISGGNFFGILLALAMFAYSVYLYRGGRYGFFVW